MNPFLSTSDRKAVIEHLKIYMVLAALCLVFAALSPLFASWQNLLNILLSSATIGLLAIGAAFVIGSAGLDLSVGSVMALSSATGGVAAAAGWGSPVVLLACLLTGILAGWINGTIIARLGIPAFIVTLGMLSIARGLALIMTDGRPVYGLPDVLVFLGQGSVLGVPTPIWIFLITGLVLQLILRRSVFGTYTLCIGDNEKAAIRAGVNVQRHKVKLYMLSGLLAAMAGIVFMGRVNAADPSAGLMYELTAITAAILGGTHLFGGRASVAGAMVGALIMGVLHNGLTLLAVPSYYQQVAIGVVLILAVSLDKWASRGI